MKVEIWSDVICPLYYLGKRKFEIALQQFENKDEVEVIWCSIQLDPFAKFHPERTIHEYLPKLKGISIEDAKELLDIIIERSVSEGLEFNFDTTFPANTLDAHRLLHLALEQGLQDEAQERLFKAFFTEGKNIEDKQTLQMLGEEIGLDPALVTKLLESDQFKDEVGLDFQEARVIGIRSLPFFLFNSKYSISGAQESTYFLNVLRKVWAEEGVNI